MHRTRRSDSTDAGRRASLQCGPGVNSQNHDTEPMPLLTAAKTAATAIKTIVKKATNGPLLSSNSSSSRPCSSSGTTPKTAIITAPPATNAVPTTQLIPNLSPKSTWANRALKTSEMAPKGARITMGSASSWKSVAKTLEVIYMMKPISHSGRRIAGRRAGKGKRSS